MRGTDWSYARYFVDGPDKSPFEFLHDLKHDPAQLVNIAALPTRLQTEGHALALLKMRKRCNTLVAANGLPMKDIPGYRPPAPKK